MAAGLLHHLAPGRYIALSAGITPASRGNPLVIRVMDEMGIDISDHEPGSLSALLDQRFDRIILLTDEVPPLLPPAGEVIYVPLSDPAVLLGEEEEQLAALRSLRDAIAVWIRGNLL